VVIEVASAISRAAPEGAPLGVFLTLDEPSKPMLVESSAAGVFYSELSSREYRRVRS
jgi:hypothetical protein